MRKFLQRNIEALIQLLQGHFCDEKFSKVNNYQLRQKFGQSGRPAWQPLPFWKRTEKNGFNWILFFELFFQKVAIAILCHRHLLIWLLPQEIKAEILQRQQSYVSI
jgi:hypothetical protein